MRALVFTSRNIKEMLRNPLSYLFCLGLPLVMLVVMTLVNASIPKPEIPAEAGAFVDSSAMQATTVFNIENLTPGIAVFGLTFIMLFCCISVASDRASAFLTRLYASPMKSTDFIIGYTLPYAIIACAQVMITYIAGEIISLIVNGESFNIGYMLLSIPLFIPSVILCIGIGIFFGTLLNDKAAPGVCSAFITAAAILGGIWMDIDSMGSAWVSVCSCLPFYHAVKYARCILVGDFGSMVLPLLITTAFALVIFVCSALLFAHKSKADK
ncbi:MAG: ABC transporter permease [Clostridia bacterium]|nr:ABC transporter permease [Clostridia bacterium]